MPPSLQITPSAARRFLRRALLLDAPAADVGAALAHHGYIQIDPINVCGRMHDLILRNRVADYREGGLMRHIHGDSTMLAAEQRVAFEHHMPDTGILVAFPLEAWPHLQTAMQGRAKRPGAQRQASSASRREFVDARQVVYNRDLYRCVVCGEQGQEVHHRRNRGMGGAARDLAAHAFSRLVLLCRVCHDRVGDAPGWAECVGLWVRHGVADLAAVPLLYRGDWVLLDDEGGITRIGDGGGPR